MKKFLSLIVLGFLVLSSSNYSCFAMGGNRISISPKSTTDMYGLPIVDVQTKNYDNLVTEDYLQKLLKRNIKLVSNGKSSWYSIYGQKTTDILTKESLSKIYSRLLNKNVKVSSFSSAGSGLYNITYSYEDSSFLGLKKTSINIKEQFRIVAVIGSYRSARQHGATFYRFFGLGITGK